MRNNTEKHFFKYQHLLASLLLWVALLLLLGGCGGKNEATQDTIPSTEAPELVTVKVVVNFVPNMLFSKYDVDLLIDDKTVKTLPHGTDAIYEFQLEKGIHSLAFTKHGDISVKGEVSLDATCDMETGYKIACYKDKVTVEVAYIDQSIVETGKAKINEKASGFVNKNYEDVIETLKSLGFTNIRENPLYDIVWGVTTSGSVKEVLIDGTSTYNRGDIFDKNVEIIVTYHLPSKEDPAKQTTEAPMKPPTTEALTEPSTTEVPTELPTTEIPTTEAPTEPPTTEVPTEPPTTEAPTEPPTTEVPTETPTTEVPTEPPTTKSSWPSHSSGDRAIAKEGNSGVYAYVKTGKNYDIYYIIDFEQGYVYYFLYGPDDKYSADRIKIVQGDLNSFVFITYHDGNSEWSYGLHFKWANQPDILVVQDEQGYEERFMPTDLGEALKKMNTLVIYDY